MQDVNLVAEVVALIMAEERIWTGIENVPMRP